MELKNRKTGERGILALNNNEGEIEIVVLEPDMPLCGNSILARYDSVAKLSKEWEDYEPKEPLIKDEKIRKAVRAWAEANRTKYVWVSIALKGIDIMQDFEHLQLTEYKQSITFEFEADFKSGTYTIAELCGEEECVN